MRRCRGIAGSPPWPGARRLRHDTRAGTALRLDTASAPGRSLRYLSVSRGERGRCERAIEEAPDAFPRVDLFGVVLRLPGQPVHAAVERVAADRMVVH